jgi:hypothetical protein
MLLRVSNLLADSMLPLGFKDYPLPGLASPMLQQQTLAAVRAEVPRMRCSPEAAANSSR